MWCPAYDGKTRQVAAKGGMGLDSEPDRARLKLMHQQVHKVLSAHLFFGALCRNMWCTNFLRFVESIRILRCIGGDRAT